MGKIFIIGSVNIDYTIYVDKFPKVGETLLGKNKVSALGGKGVNQALAATKAGGDVTFLCFVGKDDCGVQIKKHIKNYKIKAFVKTVEYPSGNAFIFVDNDGNNEIVVASCANYVNDIKILESYKKGIEHSEYIVLQNEIHPDMNEYIIRTFGKTHKIVWNPAPAKKINEELYSYIYMATPNEGELKVLTGKETLDEGIQYLLDKGVQNVIVTLGSKGCIFVSKNETIKQDTFKVNAIDTVAAGDTFLGCLVASLSNGKEMKDALRFACAGAALSTTKVGAAPSIPSLDEINKLLEKN